MFVALSFLTVGILLTLAAMLLFDTINHIVLAASSSHSHSKNGNNNKDSSNSIQVCCVWNKELTHGVLTYSINAGNLELKHTVTNAIDQWNENIKHLNVKLVPVSTEDANKADIHIKFNSKASKINTHLENNKLATKDIHFVKPGKSVFNFDKAGFISNVDITLSKSAFGNTLNTHEIEQIALHELGHALGLGHANFKGDLMSPIGNDENLSISRCDINAVKQANDLRDMISNSKDHQSREINC